MALFVASDRPIELSHGWKSEPHLTIHELRETEQGVRTRLAFPYIRYLGAHTGCSCGFEYGFREPQSEEQRELEQDGRRSVAALRDFLETYLRQGVSMQFLSCWEGEESWQPREVLAVQADYFGGDSFDLPRSALLNVRGAVEQ